VAIGAIAPQHFDPAIITTIIGGTIGGYISYAGVHRLLDSGHAGIAHVPEIQRSALSGILLTGLMRTLLFLAVFGVSTGGAQLDANERRTRASRRPGLDRHRRHHKARLR
jgi:Mn2+/Fe2+ NRAMP family transporter